MWIVKLALKRPYTFVVLAILIFVFGGLAILRTPTDIFPNIDIPVVSIIWNYNGLDPQDISDRIVSITERNLTTTVDNIAHIESQSYYGIAVVKVFFQPSVSIDKAIAQITANGIAEQQLNDYGLNFIRPRLVTVEGAAVPYPYGGKQRQVQVDLNTAALQAKGLSALDVVTAISAQNLILPTGTSKVGSKEYNVDISNAAPQSIEQLNRIPIKTVGGTTTYIADVAWVRDGFPPQTNIVRVNGQRATLLTVQKNGNASTLNIINGIKALLPQIRQTVPPALEIKPLADQSIFVKGAIQGVVKEASIAACLTGLMILLFLGSWRSTLIIAVSIPLAILTSIIALSALGETINIMTLGGLALAVGILVDDATVEIENINRNIALGKEVEHAILDGAQQIAVPAFVATLAICIVFVPMFLLSGVARYLFVPLGEAVVFAMLASYLLSRTVVPTMAKFLLRGHEHDAAKTAASRNPFVRLQLRFEEVFERLRERYHALLERCLHYRRAFLIAFFAACLGSLALIIPWLGQDFFPTIDSGSFNLHLRAPTGTRIEETARLCDLVERSIKQQLPPGEISNVIDNIGLPYSGINTSYNNTGTVGSSDADILVTFAVNHHKTAKYVHDLRIGLSKQFPGVTFSFLPSAMVSQILNFGSPAPIDIQVLGNDQAGNQRYANALLEQVKYVPGIVDARIQQPFDQPYMHLWVDRTKAQEVGFNTQAIAQNVLISLGGSFQTSPTYWLDPKNRVSYQVSTQTPQYRVATLQDLANMPITGPTPNVPPSLLASFASVQRGSGTAVVSHYNIQPAIDIFAAVQGRDLGGVSGDITRILDKTRNQLPRGSQVVLRGQAQTMRSSYIGLLAGLFFAVLLVYLLIVVNFQSWLDPFIIICALPAALAGIAWFLFLTHTTLSVPALRPVLMTALAMIIGMLPMALGLGDGGEQNAPLGRAVIGGLLFATVSTLLFVPTVFSVLHGLKRGHGETGVQTERTL